MPYFLQIFPNDVYIVDIVDAAKSLRFVFLPYALCCKVKGILSWLIDHMSSLMLLIECCSGTEQFFATLLCNKIFATSNFIYVYIAEDRSCTRTLLPSFLEVDMG